MKSFSRLSLSLALTGLLASCGGGGGDADVGRAATTSGVFRDAPVAGLWIQGSTGNQYTDSNGGFSYRPGETYRVYVGRVFLGSFVPTTDNATISPASLVAGQDRDTIINLSRFLMTLDSDANPANGITILSAMDTAALKWPQIDFSADPDDFASETNARVALLGVAGPEGFPGIRLVNARPSLDYVSEGTAASHLASSMSCAYSGAYVGERQSGGSLESRVALLLDYQGKVLARQFFPLGLSKYTFTRASGFSYADLLADDTVKTEIPEDGAASAWLRYRFRLSDADRVWVNTTTTPGAGGTVGSYTGDDQALTRLAGKPTALYRFAGLVSTTLNDLVYLVEVDAGTAATKTVSGRLLDLRTGNAAAISGTYTSGGLITAKATLDGRTVQWVGQLSGNTWDADFEDAGNGIDQDAVTEGCKLN